jgi:hypothetical protein
VARAWWAGEERLWRGWRARFAGTVCTVGSACSLSFLFSSLKEQFRNQYAENVKESEEYLEYEMVYLHICLFFILLHIILHVLHILHILHITLAICRTYTLHYIFLLINAYRFASFAFCFVYFACFQNALTCKICKMDTL